MATASQAPYIPAREQAHPSVAIGLAAMVALTLLTRLPFLGHPAPDFDEQLYSLIGSRMQHGLLPYVDLWDRKPIGLFLIYAFAHMLGGDGPVPYQLLAIAACLLGGWQVWRLGRHVTDSGTAALASALYPVQMAFYDSHSGQSEIFFTPVMMAMALLLLAADSKPLTKARRLCMAAMACGGLALQIKYTVLIQCLFFGGAALWLLHRKGQSTSWLAVDAALFAALGLLPTALCAGFYAFDGTLSDFLFANFQSIQLRGGLPLGETWRSQVSYAVPLLAIAAGGMLHALRIRPEAATRNWWLAAGWLASAIAGLFMVRTVYPYYFAALVPPVILVALPMFDRRQSVGLTAWTVVLSGGIALFNPYSHYTGALSERAALDHMARLLTAHVGAQSHCLYVFDGPTALYRLTGSGLPTRFIYPDHLNNELEAHALPVDPAQEVSRILANRPGAIVTSANPLTRQNLATNALVSSEISAHYRSLGQVEFQNRRLILHSRLPDADGVSPPCNRISEGARL